MHWFWRALIAVGASITYVSDTYHPRLGMIPPLNWIGTLSIRLMIWMGPFFGHSLYSSRSPPWSYSAAMAVIGQLPALLVCLTTYGLLGLRRGSRTTETRCRKCNYILRGITEPRCPEGGERI